MFRLALPVMAPEAFTVKLFSKVVSDAFSHTVPLPVSVGAELTVPSVTLPVLMAEEPSDRLLAKTKSPLLTLSVPVNAELLPDNVTSPSVFFLMTPEPLSLPDTERLRPAVIFRVAVLPEAMVKLFAKLALVVLTNKVAFSDRFMGEAKLVTFCNSKELPLATSCTCLVPLPMTVVLVNIKAPVPLLATLPVKLLLLPDKVKLPVPFLVKVPLPTNAPANVVLRLFEPAVTPKVLTLRVALAPPEREPST